MVTLPYKMWEWEGTSSGAVRKSQGYTVSQIVMDLCMLNIFLHWGTVHWQYVGRGFVSYYLVYICTCIY